MSVSFSDVLWLMGGMDPSLRWVTGSAEEQPPPA